MEGWIKLHRSVMEHPIWNKAGYLRAWVYLIFAAAYEPRQVTVGNAVYSVQRGEIVTTTTLLASQIRLSKNQTTYLLKVLKKTHMIVTDSTTLCTRIRICNYDRYQDAINADSTRIQPSSNYTATQRQQLVNDAQTISQQILKKEEISNEEETFEDSNESMLPSGNVSAVPDDVKVLFDMFNSLMEGKNIPQIRSIQGSRLRMLRTRLQRYGYDAVAEVFRNAAESDFLQGSTGLKASFDWLIKPDNFQKVLEGNYSNKKYGTRKNDNNLLAGEDTRDAEIDRLNADFKARDRRKG